MNCREELIEKFDANMNRYTSGRPELIPELSQIRMTLPDVTFNYWMDIRLGDREINLVYLGRAHSAGDILLHLPQDGVLYAGDIAFHGFLPAFPDGHITKWLDVMDKTQEMDFEIIVPGHGPVGTKKDFDEARELMAHLHGEIRRGFDAGKSEDETASEVNLGKFTEYLGQEHIGLITNMANRADRGDLV